MGRDAAYKRERLPEETDEVNCERKIKKKNVGGEGWNGAASLLTSVPSRTKLAEKRKMVPLPQNYAQAKRKVNGGRNEPAQVLDVGWSWVSQIKSVRGGVLVGGLL